MPSVWIGSRSGKRGKVWVVYWETRRDGIRTTGERSCGPHKALADKFATQKRQDLAAQELGITGFREKSDWSDFEATYLDHCRKHKAPRTVRNFDGPAMRLARDHFGGSSPASITSQAIGSYETALLERYRPTTARIWLRCLRTALRWGKEHGFVREVPRVDFPRVEESGRALSDAEVSALLNAVSESAKPAVLFALHTGVRRGEMLSLTWERVRKTQGGHFEAEIGGVGGPTTKTRRSRVIPLGTEAMSAMGKIQASGRVFGMVSEDVSHRVEEAAKRANLGRVRFHDLRHTWATRYMQTTGDLFGLMALGGWKSLASVKVYQHLTKTRIESANSVSYHGIYHGK